MSIRTTKLEHKQTYHLRTHEDKLPRLAGEFPTLVSFLDEMHLNCPDKPFSSGPRSSNIQAGPLPVYEEPGTYSRCEQTLQGLETNALRFDERHEQVQVYMLENDRCTVAMEVPLWINYQEAGVFQELMTSDQCLSGHLDLLAIEDGRVWIWDYKPNACKQRWVHVQLSAYALMLSHRTGVSLKNIRCGYFDDQFCRTFVPRQAHINVFDFYAYVPAGESRLKKLKPKPKKQDMPTIVFDDQGNHRIDISVLPADSHRRSAPGHEPQTVADGFPGEEMWPRRPRRPKICEPTPSPPNHQPIHGDLEWYTVMSEAIQRIAYLSTTEQLHVEFPEGRQYVYASVPIRVFQNLLNAESIGRFFHANIRTHYIYRRVA